MVSPNLPATRTHRYYWHPYQSVANKPRLEKFKLRFQALLDVEDLDCGDKLRDPCLVTVKINDADKGLLRAGGVAGCTDLNPGRPAPQQAVDAAPDGATMTVNGRGTNEINGSPGVALPDQCL